MKIRAPFHIETFEIRHDPGWDNLRSGPDVLAVKVFAVQGSKLVGVDRHIVPLSDIDPVMPPADKH